MSLHKEQLKGKILQILERLTHSGGIGHTGEVPNFDYYALDYLDFAEMNLRRHESAVETRERDNELISCVSNLKRALDCQVECFLSSWNLREIVKKHNLGLDRKLSFLADIGLFSSRTIGRFTNLRNKIEHEFQRPAVHDLEALFDLVTAFIAVLQTPMTSGFSEELDFDIVPDPQGQEGSFSIRYICEKQQFVATWCLYTKPKKGKLDWRVHAEADEEGKLEAGFIEPEDFTYFFRILLLLNQIDSFASYEHMKSRIKA